MSPVDITILEWLEDKGMAAPPIQVWLYYPAPEDERPTRDHVNRRLSKMRDYEMVEKHPDATSLYRITDKGLRFLNDPNAKAEEFMPPEDNEDDEDDDLDDGDLEEEEES